jgi:hypothetical protein
MLSLIIPNGIMLTIVMLRVIMFIFYELSIYRIILALLRYALFHWEYMLEFQSPNPKNFSITHKKRHPCKVPL